MRGASEAASEVENHEDMMKKKVGTSRQHFAPPMGFKKGRAARRESQTSQIVVRRAGKV